MAEDDPKGAESKKQRRARSQGAKPEAGHESAGEEVSPAETPEEEAEEETATLAETVADPSGEMKPGEEPDRAHTETAVHKKSKGYSELMRVDWKPKKRR